MSPARYPKRNDRYRSGLEAAIGEELDRGGHSFGYEYLTIPFVEPARNRRYTPDFFLRNGIVIEAKGRFTSGDRKKLKLIRDQYPDLDIRLVFSRAGQKINKRSKTTCAKWCKDKGFQYAEKLIPQDWIEEPPNQASLAVLRKLEEHRYNT